VSVIKTRSPFHCCVRPSLVDQQLSVTCIRGCPHVLQLFLCFAVSVVLSCATVLVLRWSEATGLVGKLSTECRRDSRLSRFLVAVYTILEVFVSGTFISALWMTLQFHVATFLVVMCALKLAVLHLGESGIMETTD
jgi:hypothetical protein